MANNNIPLGSLAARLGSATGSAVAKPFDQGLDMLYERKMKQMHSEHAQQVAQQERDRKAKTLYPFLGKEVTDMILNQDPKVQENALSNLLSQSRQGQFGPQGQEGAQGFDYGSKLSQLLSSDQGFSEDQLNDAMQNGEQAPQGNNVLAQAFKPKNYKYKEEKLNLAKEANDARNIKNINDYGKEIEQNADINRSLVKDAKLGLKYLATGKAKTGFLGKFTPEWAQTHEGQELARILNEIALTKSKIGKGLPSKYRIIAEQAAKGNIYNDPKLIKNFLEDMAEDQDVLRDIARDMAFKDIRQMDEQPKDISKEVDKLLPKYMKRLLTEDKEEGEEEGDHKFEDIKAHPERYENGTKFPHNGFDYKIEDGVLYKKVDGRWRQENG